MPTKEQPFRLRRPPRSSGSNKSTLARQVKEGSVRSHAGKVLISEVKADRVANLDPALRKAATAREAVQSEDDAREAISFILKILAEEGVAPPEGKGYRSRI